MCVGYDTYSIGVSHQCEITPTAKFVAINALTSSRRDKNVTCYRNFLIEMDVDTLVDQANYIKSIKLPYSTCVYSGGKSLHYIISLEEPLATEVEYREMGKKLLTICDRADQTTKNPSRFTRFPDAVRTNTGRLQILRESRARVSRAELDKLFKCNNTILAPSSTPPSVQRSNEGGSSWSKLKNFTKKFIRHAHAPKGRNNTMFAASLDMLDNGFTMKEVEDIMVGVGQALDLGSDELYRIFKSVEARHMNK